MRVTEGQIARALAGWRGAGVPLTTALVGAIRDGVLDGRLRPGDALPAERRLAAALGLSRGTVVAALDTLRAEGWVVTRHGSASVLRLAPSAAERLAPRAATGEDGVVDLRRAVPAAPAEAYQAAMTSAITRSGRLLAEDGVPGPGLPELRELIARDHTRTGLATRPENIFVTTGARAAFALLCAYLRPRSAAVEVPTYHGGLDLLRDTGARLSGFGVTTAGWDLDQLAEAFSAARGGIAYLTPDFHNPTGALMDGATRRRVADLAARHSVTVIADETMRDLDLRADPGPSPRIRGAVLVGSTSKTVWAGLRVGWIRASADMITALQSAPLSASLSAAPIQQLVAAELLAGNEDRLRSRLARLRAQRDHLSTLLAGDPRWHFTVPDGGLSLWLRLTAGRADQLVARAESAGLRFSPGSRFAADATLARFLRVPFTPPVEVLDRVAETLRGVA
ncbi:PLP-dependent aminotransferase family protein [Catenulispora subtropica]|uniref:PLP-dependent aminotransferase family protein n=1 Tax=Catenulispora subtropica TaxID=450798 RepID=A0ABP5D6Q7_9ACTN